MVPFPLSTIVQWPLPELLLDSLRRMAAAGYQPRRYIVLRLTDGRVRAYALADDNSAPLEIIGRVRNESGPLSSAFLVGSNLSDGGFQLFVEDLLNRRRMEQFAAGVPGRIAWNEMRDQEPSPRNAARYSSSSIPAICLRPLTLVASG